MKYIAVSIYLLLTVSYSIQDGAQTQNITVTKDGTGTKNSTNPATSEQISTTKPLNVSPTSSTAQNATQHPNATKVETGPTQNGSKNETGRQQTEAPIDVNGSTHDLPGTEIIGNDTTTAPTTSVKPTNKPTPSSTVTSVSPPSSSSSPTVVPQPTAVPSTPSPTHHRGFDGPSFVGGIVLALGLVAIGFVAFKFYKARTELNYHTL